MIGIVTRERSSTSLNFTTSSILDTDMPDFLEDFAVILSRKEVPLVASVGFDVKVVESSSCFAFGKLTIFLNIFGLSLLGPLPTVLKLFSLLTRL